MKQQYWNKFENIDDLLGDELLANNNSMTDVDMEDVVDKYSEDSDEEMEIL